MTSAQTAPEQHLDLSGKAAFISGAAVGIGRATALALGKAGAIIGLHYYSSAAAALSLQEELATQHIKSILLPADLTQEAEANAAIDKLVAEAGRLDIVVNNSGGLVKRAKIEDCLLENWQKSLDINLTSAFLVTKRAIPHLRATGNGSIVNILSLSVQTGGANGGGAYAAAKGGLMVFTHTLAKELAPQIRTNSVMPGTVETQHHEIHSTPEMMENYRKQTPLGRNTYAEEVASSVLFLSSNMASHINGALIDISGGRFLR
ncbi:SDR family NAD(P)-dependent oxidoreductase [Methylovulum psychrotolerans]|uniref:NAD(P)-dependent oxidoreductase n=1 Tax=Methylovulum psychrotolerans TaxID=1704499 RepID=A0A1Z4BV12_9GAMM|nr:SDR family NAD(P)-dependent oxidoreductase [Methylovulum psychrotolerans]ASF45080.1 short-chain dehydrogenase [Methylovulum psychrotolerans]POZ51066.1 NAD(P)-dependent oxidoreductase [Methylovulum psychrotolerans]